MAAIRSRLHKGEAERLLHECSRDALEAMLDAGANVLECYRVLRKAGANVVGEILSRSGTFYEWDHYPEGDVFDQETHSQYYYHAHRGAHGEHGHFHTFLRYGAIPSLAQPVAHQGAEPWPSGEETLCHLVAISMDARGFPTHLFTTNRWVTGESVFAAADVFEMAARFEIDHAYPSWPTNRWLTAMLALFRPQIGELLRRRDAAIAAWVRAYPERDVYEDRTLEVTSITPISVERQLALLDKALRRRADGDPALD